MPVTQQLLSVEFTALPGPGEGILFKPYALDREGGVPDAIFLPVPHDMVTQLVGEVRNTIEVLLLLATQGLGRGEVAIEKTASNLARRVIPPEGLIGTIEPGAHPLFDTASGPMYDVPWELLEEKFFECRDCSRRTVAASQYCSACGTPMLSAGGEIALTYHLAYLSRGNDRTLSQGSRFLFVEDPKDDLCQAGKDPGGTCESHLDELHGLADRHGYEIQVLRGGNATASRVRKALADPAVAAVYYFGHGYYPRRGGEGCLLLADSAFYTSQIREAAPRARLVFLNACVGAEAGRDWIIEKSQQSIAHAFIRGNPGKVVIAPLFPLVNVQAADAARTFFREVLSGSTCGDALRAARKNSLGHYEAGKPDISWMAYRYFGDPNRLLLLPSRSTTVAPSVAIDAPIPKVFDDQGILITDVFAFPIDQVLLRAAKRRNSQDRDFIGMVDVVAGMIRCGDLTRHVLRHHRLEPDDIYRSLSNMSDAELGSESPAPEGAPAPRSSGDSSTEDAAEALFDALLRKWLVREERDLSPSVIEMLSDVHQRSQRRSGPSEQICEVDMLETLVRTTTWDRLSSLGLPASDFVGDVLAERERDGRIDENGLIRLPRLSAEANSIVEAAHRYAQQNGTCPIPHRLLLAAFLEQDDGYAGRCMEWSGVDPTVLYQFLLTTTVHGSAQETRRHWFGLSEEAGERILRPTLDRATTLAGGVVEERDLFLAFCEVADPAFKTWLTQLPQGVDLDELSRMDGTTEPECFTGLAADARRIVVRAHGFARARGTFPIPSRAVLAAFLAEPEGFAARLLSKGGREPRQLASVVLSSFGASGSVRYTLDAAACARAVTPAVKQAKRLVETGEAVGEGQLFQAFCETAGSDFKRWLKQAPLKLDLDELARVAQELVPLAKATVPGAEEVDEEVAALLDNAVRLAQESGADEVRTPHLVAAMVGDGSTPTASSIRRKGVDPMQLKSTVLMLLEPGEASAVGSAALGYGKNATASLRRAVDQALARGERRATIRDLQRALVSSDAGAIGVILRAFGMTPEP